MRAYQGRIFRLDQHLDRLASSMQYLGLALSISMAQLGRQLVKALRDSEIREAMVRVALLPQSQRLSVRPRHASHNRGREQGVAPRETWYVNSYPAGWRSGAPRLASPSIVVQAVPLPTPQMYRRGLRVAIVPTRRFPVSQIDPQAKFSARLGSVQAVIEAQVRGVDEAIFTDGTGYVTESTASNLGIITRGAFLAPPCWMGLLAGITWQALEEVARELGMSVREVPLTRHDLYNADEAFLSSTLKEIIAVTTIDGRRIGSGKPGPSTKRLHAAFRRLVRRELRLT